MPLTPSTSAAGYCTPTAFMDFYDERLVGAILRTDNRISTREELLADTRLQRLLKAASGELESACFTGRRYATEDLEALIATDGAGADLIRRIVAALAADLIRARPGQAEELQTSEGKLALERLQRLRDGEAIFPFEEAEEAGLPDTVEATDFDLDARHQVTDRARRVFGTRRWTTNTRGND